MQKVFRLVFSWLVTTTFVPLCVGISPQSPVSKMDSSEAAAAH